MKHLRCIITAALLICASLFIPLSSAAQAVSLSDEQQAAVVWVMENATVDLPQDTAALIVQSAYYFADEQKLDAYHLLAMMRVESGFDLKAHSHEGAKGLMQVLPKFHKAQLRQRNPYDAVVSIEVGSLIYRECLDKARGNVRKAVSCYSGGARQYYRMVQKYKTSLTHRIVAQLFIAAPNDEQIVAHNE